MIWSYDSLWEKTKLYHRRALEKDRESPMFPFWIALGLEFLGRSVLAKVHPALLADPRDGHNLLYVFGYTKLKYKPRSIPAKSVFRRCKSIIPEFTDDEFKILMSIVEKRNEELHTGSPSFEDFPTRLWLNDYYRISKILLEFLELDLKDLLGSDESEAAKQMIEEYNAELISTVKQKIAHHRKNYEVLSSEEKEKLIENNRIPGYGIFDEYTTVDCSSCGNEAKLLGKLVSRTEARLVDGEIIQSSNYLPVGFSCKVCGLEFDSYAEIAHTDFDGQFTITRTHDPINFHGIDDNEIIDEYADEMMWDYGND